jgi:putative spermidine/putrescine transport system permease protein
MSGIGQKLFMAAIVVFVAAPLIVVAGVSFNAQRQLLFPPRGFSLQWYLEMFLQADWQNAIVNSLVVAVLSALIAVAIAFPLAYFLWRYRVRYGPALYGLGVAPFMLPPVITALGFLVFWTNTPLYGSITTTLVSHAIFFVTLPLVTITLGLQSIDRQIIEASTTLGADDRTVFRTVVLPLVRPYLISGYAFAFVLSLNEYIVAFMVTGLTVETLPIKIFNSLRYGYTPVMASVSVMFVVVGFVVYGAIARFGDLPKLLGAWAPRET